MAQSNKPVSRLRQRMIEDMTMRKFSAMTRAKFERSRTSLSFSVDPRIERQPRIYAAISCIWSSRGLPRPASTALFPD